MGALTPCPCPCPLTPGKPAKDKHHTSYCETGRKVEAKAIYVELPRRYGAR